MNAPTAADVKAGLRLRRLYLTNPGACGVYSALFCRRSPIYGRVCATRAYGASA